MGEIPDAAPVDRRELVSSHGTPCRMRITSRSTVPTGIRGDPEEHCMTTLTAQQAIDAAHEVAATLAKDAPERDRANADPHAEVQLLHDAALPAILLPREVGGGSRRCLGRAHQHVAALRAVVNDVALEVTSKIFAVTGARATGNTVGMDRFWRNVRTHTPRPDRLQAA